MACHIYAAAPGKGAKRYDANMSRNDRRNVKNGIWMCYKHGKQIDNDECRFSSETLFKWKEVAEKRAQIEHEIGRPIDKESRRLLSLGLARNSVRIETADGSENSIIGEALRDSCVSAIWGSGLVSYVRDYLIERTRNAFKHGGATNVKLEIDTNKLTLIDDGDDFNHLDLLNSNRPRGGASSKRNLIEKYSNEILSLTRRIDGINYNVISLITDRECINNITPCTIELTYRMASHANFDLEIFKSCSNIYVTLPQYFSTSDLYWLHTILPTLDNDARRLVFVMDEVADYISEELANAYPEARIMDLSMR